MLKLGVKTCSYMHFFILWNLVKTERKHYFLIIHNCLIVDVNNFIINLIFTYKNKNQLKIHSKYVFEFMLDIFSKRV